MNFAMPIYHRVKVKEGEKMDKYLNLARELKKVLEHEGDSDTNYNWSLWKSFQEPGKETG